MATLRCCSRTCLELESISVTIKLKQLTVFKFSTNDFRQSMRNLSNEFDKDNIKQNRALIQSAFKIYKEQNTNALIINDMLKMCVKFKLFSNYLLLWKDIENISNLSSNNQSILYSLLLKCCVNSVPINVQKCIQTLQWIKDKKYKIKPSNVSEYFKDVNKLLSKGKISNLAILQRIHALIDENDIYVQTTLIDEYGKYQNGDSFALNVFYSIDAKQINSIALNAAMNALIKNKQNEGALTLYQKYAHLHDDRSHVLALKICANLKQISFGMNIHQKNKDIEDIYFRTALIHFYGCNERMDESLEIFAKMSENNPINIVSVNAMMKAFVDNKSYQNALKMYKKYENFANERSHNMAIKACIKLNELNKAKSIVSKITANEIKNVPIKNTLIDFYGHCGEVLMAQKMYDSIPRHQRDIVGKNALCCAYFKNNQSVKALAIYENESDGLIKDDISHIYALKACMEMNEKEKGKKIHSEIERYGKECSIELKTTLIEFYGYFCDVPMMQNIFDSIRHPNNQCIGVLMSAYSMNECDETTLKIYEKYEHLHNEIIHLLAIKACIKCDRFEKGKEIHSKYENVINQNVQLQNVFIDFYGHFGHLLNAEKIFNALTVAKKRDIFSFNSMMNAYFECSEYVKCIELFNTMQGEIIPDAISYSIALKSCVESTAYHIGFEIDQRLKNMKNAKIRNHTSVIINLIELYGKCGKLNAVESVFNECERKKNEIAIWNAYIKAFGRNGELAKAKQIFYRMQTETDLIADRKTFLILLGACNHCGDVSEAESIWLKLNQSNEAKIKYDCHIVTTLVDCFVRASKLKQAKKLIFDYEKVANKPYEPMWLSLLNGCKKFNDQKMANFVYEEMKSRFEGATSHHSSDQKFI